MFLEGADNPGNRAHVDTGGRLAVHSVSLSEQSSEAISGDAYNLNTGTLTLTNAVETPIFYLKNDSEDKPLMIPRIFVTFGASTGGAGVIEATVYYNPTGGTIISSGTDNPPQNFNAGSSKTLAATAKVGATGNTITGGTVPIEFLFNSDSARHFISFEAVVIPRGASMAFTVTPQVGNTSMQIQAGTNIYLTSFEGG